MNNFIEQMETFIVWALILMLLLAVVLGTLGLGRTLGRHSGPEEG